MANNNSDSGTKKEVYETLVPYIREKKLNVGSELKLTPAEAKPLLNSKPPIIKLKKSS